MSIKKTYIPAKPRSNKLIGTSMSGGVAGGVSSSFTGSTDPNSHTHHNKSVIDQLAQADINVLEKLSLVDGNLKINANTYSTGNLSAFGFEEEQGGGGGSMDRLDKWVDYDASRSGWVLSAFLGKDLDTRTAKNSNDIGALNQRVEAIEGVDSDKNYIHTQGTPSDTWTINHSLNKYPSVTIIDSGGTEVIGDIKYIDTTTLLITFTSGFSGKAILN